LFQQSDARLRRDERVANGQSFGCLDNSDYHPWVKAIFEVARAGTIFQTLAHYPALIKLLLAFIPSKFKEEREKHMQMTMAKLKRRMEAGKERPDLVEGLLKKADEWVPNILCQYLLTTGY